MFRLHLSYTLSSLLPATSGALVLSFLSLSVPVCSEQPIIKVALYVDRGAVASDFRKEFARSDDEHIVYKPVDGSDIRNGALKWYDALLVPGGSALKESRSLGPEARDAVRRFIKDGGIYMGVCAGAYLASETTKTDLGLLPLKTSDPQHWYRVDDATRVQVELTQLGEEVFAIGKRNIGVKYENGPIFAPPVEPHNQSLITLGYFRSEVVADGGTRGVMVGAPAIILSKYGQGIVMAISPHFEATPGFKQVQLHALHWLYDHRTDGVPNVSARAHERKEHPTNTTTTVGDQALALAKSIFNNATVASYAHNEVLASRQIVTESDGSVKAHTDCSGFISYIVQSVAAKHYHVVREREPGSKYPQAKIWARFFDGLDTERPTDGWIAIKKWQDLKPGDLIAWEEGKTSAAGNTGHVAMVMHAPNEVREGNQRLFSVQVIDSSSVYHFAPEQLPPKASQLHRDGIGIGYIRILLSEENSPIGYWAGTYWGEGKKPIKGPTHSEYIRFARMISLKEPRD